MTPQRIQLSRRNGMCSARGPYQETCRDVAGHPYAHYDPSEDVSWTDHTEDHPDDCHCDIHRPELYT